MDRVDVVLNGLLDDVWNIQIGADRFALSPDFISLISFEAVQRESIFVRVDGDGSDTQLGRRSEHANCNFATIGDQQSFDFGHFGEFKVLSLKGGKTGRIPDGTDPRGRRSVAFRSQSLSGLMLACRQPWGGACVSGVSPRDSDHNQTPVVTRGDGMVNSPWANRRP